MAGRRTPEGRTALRRRTNPFQLKCQNRDRWIYKSLLGLKGTGRGQGDTFKETVDDVTAAIQVYLETFGAEELEVAETRLRCVHRGSDRLMARFPVRELMDTPPVFK